MENKYYTPTIEDFCVGFEYQYFKTNGAGDFWLDDIITFGSEIDGIKDDLDSGNIRVKLLDQQDLEELGFEHIGSQWYQLKGYVSGELGYWMYARFRRWGDNSFIKAYRSDPKDTKDEHNEQEFLFSGNIRNKSEMKKLMKQTKLI